MIIRTNQEIEIELPPVPDTLKVKGKRQRIQIEDIDQASIDKVAAMWREALLENAGYLADDGQQL